MTSAFHACWVLPPLDAYLLHLPRKRNPLRLRLRLRFDIVIQIVIQSRHQRGAGRPFASLASLGEVFRCVLVDSLPRLQLVCRPSPVRPQGHIIGNLCINKRYGKTVCEDIVSNASTIGYTCSCHTSWVTTPTSSSSKGSPWLCPEAGSDGVADLDRSGDTYSGSRQPKRFDSRLNFWPWRRNMYK